MRVELPVAQSRVPATYPSQSQQPACRVARRDLAARHVAGTRVQAKQTAEEPSTSTEQPKEGEQDDFRFKYDFANSRWIRVKSDFKQQGVNQADKYSEQMWKDSNATMITPKTGVPYLVWPVMHAELTRSKLVSLEPEDAQRLAKEEGAVLLDVRPEYQYKAERCQGARHLSLFRLVEGTQLWDKIKKVAMAGLFMAATERDPNFGKRAAEELDKDTPVIVYCGRGGTLETGSKFGKKSFKDDPEKMFGIESRSLKGCYELQKAGFKKVLHLKGGLSQWRHNGLPTEP